MLTSHVQNKLLLFTSGIEGIHTDNLCKKQTNSFVGMLEIYVGLLVTLLLDSL